MFLKSWVEMGGFELNHHWHGINVLSIFECALLAACLCTLLALFAVRKSKRLTALALAGTLSFATAAYAANTALSGLSASGALAGANLIYVVQTAGTGGVKATMTQVATFINSLFSGDFTVASGGAATLKNTGPGATGPLGSTTTSPSVTIDPQGRVTGLTSNNIAFPTAVTSVASGCGLSGGTITTTGTLIRSEAVNPQTGTTYTYLSTDCGKLVTHSNAASIAATLPQATGSFAAGFFMDVQNKGVGTLTITPTTSTINGAATLILTTGQGVRIVSDGTNYQIQSGIGGSGAVSSVTAGCGLTISPTTGSVIASANVTDVAVSGTTDTIANTQCGTVRRYTNAAVVTVTVPSPSGFAAGFVFTIKSDGANTAGVTVTPGTTIDGSGSNITLTTGQSLDVYLNASSLWATLPGHSTGGGGSTTITGDCSGTGTGTVSVSCLYPPHPGYISTFWYMAPTIDSVVSGNVNALNANTINCAYGAIGKLITIKGLGGSINVAGTSNVQFAVYSNSAGRPATLLAKTNSIADTGTGSAPGALVSNVQIGPGSTAGRDIWWCVNSNDSTVAFNTGWNSAYQATLIGDAALGTSAPSFGETVQGIACQTSGCLGGSSTFGTWPASLSGSTGWTPVYGGTFNANTPAFFLQVN